MKIYEYSDSVYYIAFGPNTPPAIYYSIQPDGRYEVIVIHNISGGPLVLAEKFPNHFTRNMLRFVFGKYNHSVREVLFNIVKYGK